MNHPRFLAIRWRWCSRQSLQKWPRQSRLANEQKARSDVTLKGILCARGIQLDRLRNRPAAQPPLAWYTRHAARAARAQADAAKQQAAAAKAQLSLDQDRRNDELARRRKEDEEAAPADLRVTTVWVRPHPPQIVLHNHGPHAASEISLSYLDADDGLPPPDTSRWDELAATLGPERASSVDTDVGLNTTRRFRVTLRWKDGTGSRSTVEQLQLH